MSSNIDPITGLPDGYIDPLSYQIPLNSQPVLAPEWNPQGKINATLFPDNIPTFFATLQAMNGSNPSVVQALETQPGTQALQVYDLASGGGGGGGGLSPVAPLDHRQTEFEGTGPSFYSETLNGTSNAVKVLHYVECCMSNDGSGVSVDPFFAITFDLVPHFGGGRYHMHQWIWRQPATGVPGNLDTNAVIYLVPAWDFSLNPNGPEIFDLEVNLPPGKNMGQFMMYYESVSI